MIQSNEDLFDPHVTSDRYTYRDFLSEKITVLGKAK